MQRQPQLTIGMAHHTDFHGAYFTIQSLRLNHDCADAVEIVVIDNSPRTADAQDLRNYLASIPNTKYVPTQEAVGTSVPRDRVFREASAPTVLCVDCHVLFAPGAIAALRDWWEGQPRDSRDMITGPILYDNLSVLGTHFNRQWRAEMWGTWGIAWACPCRKGHFSPVQQTDDALTYVDLVSGQRVDRCHHCDRSLPSISWSNHEHHLRNAGYTLLVEQSSPFEIPGQGLGAFSMRREAWVGFHSKARGFGGEELYVHQKVRNAGGHVYCHPAIKWCHRFGRPGGPKYPLNRYSKVRNYVLEFQELNWDLGPIEEHFVSSGLLTKPEWLHLLENPGDHVAPPEGFRQCHETKSVAAPQAALPQPPPGEHNLDTLYEWCAGVPRDLQIHAPKIREFAGASQHVTAVVKRREWDVFLAAGRPDDLVVWTTEPDPLHAILHATVEATETNPYAARRIKHYTVHALKDLAAVKTIDETDLLVLDSVHHADRLFVELTQFSPHVRRRIILRGTQAFGEVAEGGHGPGLLAGLRRWMQAHPDWSVIYHSTEQYGLTVISRDSADKPRPPKLLTLAANFTAAVASHVADGLAKVTVDQLNGRLGTCMLCDQRRDNRCMVCGCFLEPKAAMRSSTCPLGKWSQPG